MEKIKLIKYINSIYACLNLYLQDYIEIRDRELKENYDRLIRR